jgi:phosphatidylserine/phosphatidylglycerophosphate/cardiolipin synthase-like enzyme
MAKFLNTTGVSYHLEELIRGTKERLILISPYLQFTERIKEHLCNLNIQKTDIRIVYKKNNLKQDDNNWLEGQIGIRTSLCKNLHAKCYINENEAIITSMNLHEFSQQNNNEMGILISKAEDSELYKATNEEANRLLTISKEIRAKSSVGQKGFCIRTGVIIPFDVKNSLSVEAYKSWNQYNNKNYRENFCHYSGEASNGDTSVRRPILKTNWKKAKEIFNF